MFERNKERYSNKNFKNEKLTKTILDIYKKKKIKNNTGSIIEIGCGNGSRLEFLSKKIIKKNFYGIDPSSFAIREAKNKKIRAFVGTADKTPFKDRSFEMVIFGFCLYLVDDDDLFNVIREADRILNKKGILIIYDFYDHELKYKLYKHDKKIKSRHMDYKKLFLYHPSYKLISDDKFIYEKKNHKNKKDTYTSISCLLKNNYK